MGFGYRRGKRHDSDYILVDLDPQSNATQATLPEDIWMEFYDQECCI